VLGFHLYTVIGFATNVGHQFESALNVTTNELKSCQSK
jgi:hypothetical protein